jgi:hypothetical protein
MRRSETSSPDQRRRRKQDDVSKGGLLRGFGDADKTGEQATAVNHTRELQALRPW